MRINNSLKNRLGLLQSSKIIGLTVFGLTMLSGLNSHASFAQDLSSRDVISLQNQIAQLKSQVSQLQAQSSSGAYSGSRSSSSQGDSGSGNGLLTELVTRVSTLEEQQRTMRGELDDLTNQLQTKIDTLNKKIDDMKFAAGDNSGSSSAPTAASSTGAATSATSPSSNSGSSSGQSLKDGQQALLSGNYTDSESIARSVLSTPAGDKTISAHFLLAQSLAGQKRYKDASLGYYEIYRKFPKSPRAPEALLGVGISLMKNGDNKSACQALQLLDSKFPNASSRIKKASSDLNKRAQCS